MAQKLDQCLKHLDLNESEQNQKIAQGIPLENITPEYVDSLLSPCEEFLCPLSANTYNIQFTEFKIRDVVSGQIFFEVKQDPKFDVQQTIENTHNNSQQSSSDSSLQTEEEEEQNDEDRIIRYQFHPNFFALKEIGTTLTFTVGAKEVKNFRMIEKHFFRGNLLHSFDFTFPFCIPNTTNTWETIYEIPELTKQVIQDMIDNPWETKSDSFYFVGSQLIMHNMAEYSYSVETEQGLEELQNNDLDSS